MNSIQKEPSMNTVQVDQKSYEMPPREGFSVAHFLTVADIDRSGLGSMRRSSRGRIPEHRRQRGRACVHSDREYSGSLSTLGAGRHLTSRR